MNHKKHKPYKKSGPRPIESKQTRKANIIIDGILDFDKLVENKTIDALFKNYKGVYLRIYLIGGCEKLFKIEPKALIL